MAVGAGSKPIGVKLREDFVSFLFVIPAGRRDDSNWTRRDFHFQHAFFSLTPMGLEPAP
jgi:hypothetical protein